MITFLVLFATLSLGICTASQPLRIPDEFHYEHYNTEDGDYDSEGIDSDFDQEPEDTVCGHAKSYGGSSGVITSPPRWRPDWYRFRRQPTCTYTVAVGQNNSISLKFLTFDIGLHYPPCMSDWFQIGCSIDNQSFVESTQLCGTLTWKPMLKFDNCTTMKLKFSFRPYWISFEIRYNITSKENEGLVEDLPVVDCGETLFTNFSGSIALPTQSGVPLAILNCTYMISSTFPSVINLYIRKLDLMMLTNDIGYQRRNEFEIECVESNNENQTLPYSHRWQTLSATELPTTVYCRSLNLFIHSESYDPRESYVIPYTIQGFSESTPAPRPTRPWRWIPRYPPFTFESDKSCGNEIYTESSGAITSPRFPLEYPHSLDCSYDIIAGENKSVSLIFSSFQLEIPSIFGCMYDYVTIHCLVNGTNVTRPYTDRRFCGEIKWSSAIRLTGCTNVILKFIADSSVARGGFKIQYNVSASGDVSSSDDLPTEIPCGEMLFTQSAGVITIPRNPTGYLGRINCTYVVSANQSSTMSVNVSTLSNLHYSFQNCKDGNMTFECVDNHRVASFCQIYAPLFFVTNSFSNCQVLKLTIQSDTFDVQETLQLPFTVVAEADRCGNTSFSDDSGFVSSPGYPKSYGDNLNCTYTIDVGSKRSILLEFQEFHLEDAPTGECRNDWLMIRCLSNRTTSNPYLNTRHCERMVPALVLQDCHAVTLQFVTDSTVVQRGFQIFYAACESKNCAFNTSKLSGCGNTSFTDSSGFITSPGYPARYPQGSNCIYTIDVAQNKTVSLDFLSFDVGYVPPYMHYRRGFQRHCIYDWLMIHCLSGETELSSEYMNKKLCGQGVWQFTLHGCESVMLHFTTSRIRIGNPQGFSIFYETSAIYSDCGKTSFSGSSGNITSPNFPGRYSHNLNCVYSIAVEQNDSVSLEFLTFDLDNGFSPTARPGSIVSNPKSCVNDWLMISCAPMKRINQYENTRLCGLKEVPFTWTVSGCMFLNLIFVTDTTVAKSGFKIQYEISSATTEVTLPSPPSGISTASELSSSPNSVAKGAEELKSSRASPLLLLLLLPVLLGLGFGLVFLIRRRRFSVSNHERLLENESLEKRSSENVSLAQHSVFQPMRSDASVNYVPLQSMKSDDREVSLSFENYNQHVNNI